MPNPINVKVLNIFEKLGAITTEISRVAKNLSVETGAGKSYKAVGEGDIIAAVKPLEDSYRVYSYPVSRRIVESGTIESASKTLPDGTKVEGKKSLFMREEVTYRFVNMDKTEEYVETISYGDGVDSQDKAPGKAATYADKYALMKMYKIQTGDDPDQNSSDELGDFRGRTHDIQPKPEPKLDPKSEPKTKSKFQQVMDMITGHEDKVAFSRVTAYVKTKFGIDRVNDLNDEQFEQVKNKIAEELLK